MERLLRAFAFAARVHDGQRRKDSTGNGPPFVVHPVEVAELLVAVGVTDEDVLVTAMLHDTLEDTSTSRDELASRFGERVAALVSEVSTPKDCRTRAEKKAWQAEHAGTMSYEARLVKLADQVANVKDVRVMRPWDSARSMMYVGRCRKVVDALFPGRSADMGSRPETFLKMRFEDEEARAERAFR